METAAPAVEVAISIHSLRVEGDPALLCRRTRGSHFNPLPPCGGRLVGIRSFPDALIFQSTPSVWRETFAFAMSSDALKHFNPLPPCGGRPTPFRSRMTFLLLFQSTPSVWRETHNFRITFLALFISIHSLRVEGDSDRYRRIQNVSYFNPLPPCGGRQQNCTAFRLKLSRANAILTKKNTDILLHARKNTFFLIFLRKSGCESLLLFLCA